MSGLFTFKRTKGGRTHYIASVIPTTAVVDGFTEDRAKAKAFGEADAKAMFVAMEADPKVYGRWAVLDADGREVVVFTHATPEPKKPADVGPAKVDLVGMVSKAPPSSTADRLLADEPDHSPFRELAAMLPNGSSEDTLGYIATEASAEIKALRESIDALTAPADSNATTDAPA